MLWTHGQLSIEALTRPRSYLRRQEHSIVVSNQSQHQRVHTSLQDVLEDSTRKQSDLLQNCHPYYRYLNRKKKKVQRRLQGRSHSMVRKEGVMRVVRFPVPLIGQQQGRDVRLNWVPPIQLHKREMKALGQQKLEEDLSG